MNKDVIDVNNKKSKKDEVIAEIERNIVSILLNDEVNSDEIFLQLTPDDFSDIGCRIIFQIAISFRNDGRKIDYLTLIEYIKNNPECQFPNWTAIISDIDAKYTHNRNILQYIESIKNNSIKRQLHDFSAELKNANFDVVNAKETLWNLEKKFLDITSNKKSKEIESISTVLNNFSEKFEALTQRSNEMTGTTSGYESLDKITNGFQPGDLIILAARPGIGKTALSINFMVNAAKKLFEENMQRGPDQKEKAILMFSMEMGSEQICQRILSLESGIELNVNKHKVWTEIEKTALYSSITSLMNFPIYIDDSSDLTIMDIQSKLKQMSVDKDIKLVVLDYLQLLKVSNKQTNLNRQQEVTEISRTLKKLARQFMVPIIAIAQLSRKVEERKGDQKRPILSDLRESGSIEQDADMVCFLNYADSKDGEKSTNFDSGVVVEFIIAKNRNGATTIVELSFVKPISKYFDANNKKGSDY